MTARSDISLYYFDCGFRPVFAKAWVRFLLALAFAAVDQDTLYLAVLVLC